MLTLKPRYNLYGGRVSAAQFLRQLSEKLPHMTELSLPFRQDYESATRDLRALLTLEPRYMLYGGRVSAAQFLRQLSKKVPPLSKGECWLRLYERWSAVDDIGALAAVHKVGPM